MPYLWGLEGTGPEEQRGWSTTGAVPPPPSTWTSPHADQWERRARNKVAGGKGATSGQQPPPSRLPVAKPRTFRALRGVLKEFKEQEDKPLRFIKCDDLPPNILKGDVYVLRKEIEANPDLLTWRAGSLVEFVLHAAKDSRPQASSVRLLQEPPPEWSGVTAAAGSLDQSGEKAPQLERVVHSHAAVVQSTMVGAMPEAPSERSLESEDQGDWQSWASDIEDFKESPEQELESFAQPSEVGVEIRIGKSFDRVFIPLPDGITTVFYLKQALMDEWNISEEELQELRLDGRPVADEHILVPGERFDLLSFEELQVLRFLPERIHEHLDFDTVVDVVLDLKRNVVLHVREANGKIKKQPLESIETCSMEELKRLSTHELLGGERCWTSDNRSGIDRTLHRVCRKLNPYDLSVVGLTVRIARPIQGMPKELKDLLLSADEPGSILLVGSPGAGKTTLLREIARVLDEEREIVCVIDTSSEIGGIGDVAHPAMGKNNERVRVADREKQHKVMLEALQNLTPHVMIVDEISNALEVEAAASVAARGVSLIATAHALDLKTAMDNPVLKPLFGGFETVTVGDQSAQLSRTGSKLLTQRKQNPVFKHLIVMKDNGEKQIYYDLAEAVDTMLKHQTPSFEPAWEVSTGLLGKQDPSFARHERSICEAAAASPPEWRLLQEESKRGGVYRLCFDGGVNKDPGTQKGPGGASALLQKLQPGGFKTLPECKWMWNEEGTTVNQMEYAGLLLGLRGFASKLALKDLEAPTLLIVRGDSKYVIGRHWADKTGLEPESLPNLDPELQQKLEDLKQQVEAELEKLRAHVRVKGEWKQPRLNKGADALTHEAREKKMRDPLVENLSHLLGFDVKARAAPASAAPGTPQPGQTGGTVTRSKQQPAPQGEAVSLTALRTAHRQTAAKFSPPAATLSTPAKEQSKQDVSLAEKELTELRRTFLGQLKWPLGNNLGHDTDVLVEYIVALAEQRTHRTEVLAELSFLKEQAEPFVSLLEQYEVQRRRGTAATLLQGAWRAFKDRKTTQQATLRIASKRAPQLLPDILEGFLQKAMMQDASSSSPSWSLAAKSTINLPPRSVPGSPPSAPQATARQTASALAPMGFVFWPSTPPAGAAPRVLILRAQPTVQPTAEKQASASSSTSRTAEDGRAAPATDKAQRPAKLAADPIDEWITSTNERITATEVSTPVPTPRAAEGGPAVPDTQKVRKSAGNIPATSQEVPVCAASPTATPSSASTASTSASSKATVAQPAPERPRAGQASNAPKAAAAHAPEELADAEEKDADFRAIKAKVGILESFIASRHGTPASWKKLAEGIKGEIEKLLNARKVKKPKDAPPEILALSIVELEENWELDPEVKWQMMQDLHTRIEDARAYEAFAAMRAKLNAVKAQLQDLLKKADFKP